MAEGVPLLLHFGLETVSTNPHSAHVSSLPALRSKVLINCQINRNSALIASDVPTEIEYQDKTGIKQHQNRMQCL